MASRVPGCLIPIDCWLADSFFFSHLFFFNEPSTTEIYTLSLHDALPISPLGVGVKRNAPLKILALDDLRAGRFDDFSDLPQKSDRKSTRLNSSHVSISYAVFCLKKKNEVMPIYHYRM